VIEYLADVALATVAIFAGIGVIVRAADDRLTEREVGELVLLIVIFAACLMALAR
jgi:hypothetical protein